MAKTYIPILSYRNKTMNIISHAGSYIAAIGLVAVGFANVFAQLLSEKAVEICTAVGLVGFLGGMACVGAVRVIGKIMDRKAKKE